MGLDAVNPSWPIPEKLLEALQLARIEMLSDNMDSLVPAVPRFANDAQRAGALENVAPKSDSLDETFHDQHYSGHRLTLLRMVMSGWRIDPCPSFHHENLGENEAAH